MEEDGFDIRVALHFPYERSDFRKIGTRSYDIKDFQALAHPLMEPDGEGQYNSCARTLLFDVLVRSRQATGVPSADALFCF